MSFCFKLNVDFDRYGNQVTETNAQKKIFNKSLIMISSKIGLVDISRLNETKRPDVAVICKIDTYHEFSQE